MTQLLLTLANLISNDLISHTPTLLSLLPITSATYWKMRAEKDTEQDTTNPHLIAARIIQRSGPITHHDINAVLEHQGHIITAAELEELVNLEFTTYNMKNLVGPDLNTAIREDFYKLFPATTTDLKWGIYLYTNTISNSLYYGSSVTLGERLRHYWKPHANKSTLRPILADIRATGITFFNLDVLVLPVHLREMRLMLALEQYYILRDNPLNNSILVAAGSPGGKHLAALNALKAIPVFMYQGDTLLYKFDSAYGTVNSIVSVLGVNSSTAYQGLNTDTKYLGTFEFSRMLLGEFDASTLLTSVQLVALVGKVREWFWTDPSNRLGGVAKAAQALTPPVKITRVSDGAVWIAPNYRAARTLAATVVGKTMTTDTLKNRIASGVPLNGFRYEHSE